MSSANLSSHHALNVHFFQTAPWCFFGLKVTVCELLLSCCMTWFGEHLRTTITLIILGQANSMWTEVIPACEHFQDLAFDYGIKLLCNWKGRILKGGSGTDSQMINKIWYVVVCSYFNFTYDQCVCNCLLFFLFAWG